MKRARAWLTLCVAVTSISALTASCGNDEGTGDDGGSVVGGSGGEGSGGRSGSSTGGGTSKATDLGKGCMDDANCAGDLQCFQSAQLPSGVCTSPCMATADCTSFGPGICDRQNSLCLEGCSPGGLPTKCHAREDLSCRLVDAIETATACTTDSQCGADQICSNTGVCLDIVFGCTPTCNSDADCDGGFCNLGSGLCQETPPTGLPLGARCDPAADVDPCQGVCIGATDGPSFCSGFCRISDAQLGCGTKPTDETAQGACLFESSLATGSDIGDGGFCAQLCDCDEQCLNPDLSCVAFLDGQGRQLVLANRFGFCGTAQAGDATLSTCPTAGAGGGGGEGGGSGAGSSGASNGGGGSGGAG